MINLHESIQCGVAWKKIFEVRRLSALLPTLSLSFHIYFAISISLYDAQQTKKAVELNSRSKWDFDPSSIFAQIDAFVQRCRDLLEVCEGQVLFARKSAKLPRGQVRLHKPTRLANFLNCL